MAIFGSRGYFYQVYLTRRLIIHSVNVYLIDFVIGCAMITPGLAYVKKNSDSYQTKRLMIRESE